MSNDEGLLREVDEGLAEDDFRRSIEKRMPLILGGAAAIVLGVAGYQFYDTNRQNAANDASRRYQDVLSDEAASPAERTVRLQRFAEDAPDGYAGLAQFRIAAGLASSGQSDAARKLYSDIYADRAVPARLRDLARIRAAHLALDDGRDAVIAEVGELETDETPLGFFAREALALAALKDGDYQTAGSLFADAVTNPRTPEGVRTRAREFGALANAAAAGEGLTWPAPQSAADVVRSIGADLTSAFDDAPATEQDHEGHDHAEDDADAHESADQGGDDAPADAMTGEDGAAAVDSDDTGGESDEAPGEDAPAEEER
ncbi:MAG: tetratricopeptide repeat protein [Alphaproteobacteria bacterium]|nr:tetratricopeptide repeat protein [Alphaproteobacteria bacterium]